MKSLLKGLVMIATLAALAWLAERLHFTDMLTEHWMDAQVRGQGWSGYLLFIGLGAVASGVGVPRQIVAFLGGYVFGLLEGTLFASLAVMAGCAGAFFFARWLGQSLIRRRFGHRIQRVDAFLGAHPFSMAVVIRLLPVGNNLVTNLLAGLSSVRFPPFLLGSGVGYLPQTVVFALAGSGVRLDPTLRFSLAVALFLVSGAVGAWLYRRHRLNLSQESEDDPLAGPR
ncbi:MAG: VTT domain-containing protein [Betaproteobacteria bacterium]|nr:VTT domain-containing protein [Betaproteobacteria bacterium]